MGYASSKVTVGVGNSVRSALGSGWVIVRRLYSPKVALKSATFFDRKTRIFDWRDKNFVRRLTPVEKIQFIFLTGGRGRLTKFLIFLSKKWHF